MRKEKYSAFEFIYYIVGGYCLWSAKAIHIATVKFQGSAGKEFFDPVLIFLGAFSPLVSMTSDLGFSGFITGVFILISPFMGAVLIKDFKRTRFGSYCFLMSMAAASQIVTGSWYNPLAAVGGIIALVVIGIFVMVAGVQMVTDEAKKQLGIETKDQKLSRTRKENEDRSLLQKLLNIKK